MIENNSSNISYNSWIASSGDKSPSSNAITPLNAINFQGVQTTNFNATAKSSGIGINYFKY